MWASNALPTGSSVLSHQTVPVAMAAGAGSLGSDQNPAAALTSSRSTAYGSKLSATRWKEMASIAATSVRRWPVAGSLWHVDGRVIMSPTQTNCLGSRSGAVHGNGVDVVRVPGERVGVARVVGEAGSPPRCTPAVRARGNPARMLDRMQSGTYRSTPVMTTASLSSMTSVNSMDAISSGQIMNRISSCTKPCVIAPYAQGARRQNEGEGGLAKTDERCALGEKDGRTWPSAPPPIILLAKSSWRRKSPSSSIRPSA